MLDFITNISGTLTLNNHTLCFQLHFLNVHFSKIYKTLDPVLRHRNNLYICSKIMFKNFKLFEKNHARYFTQSMFYIF